MKTFGDPSSFKNGIFCLFCDFFHLSYAAFSSAFNLLTWPVDSIVSHFIILLPSSDLIPTSAIILEVSYIEYNEGAPSQQETLNYMKKIGFEEKISIGEHYDGEQIVQKDLLFLKIGDK